MNELFALGHGNTADVYEWEEDSVLKLFKPGFEKNAEKEFYVTKQIVKTGLRVPKARNFIKFDNRTGIIFDRIHGIEMYFEMAKQPLNMEKWGRMFADLHHEIHLQSVPSLSSPREEITSLIENFNLVNEETRRMILSIFRGLDDDAVLCHGDFHPRNVMITDEGPFIIDWINSRSYHPLADVALSSVIFQVATGLPPWAIDFANAYIKRYLQLSSFDHLSLIRWQLPMAIVRFHENNANEKERILQLIEDNLRMM